MRRAALPFVRGPISSWREFLRTVRHRCNGTGLLWLLHQLGARSALLRQMRPSGNVTSVTRGHPLSSLTFTRKHI